MHLSLICVPLLLVNVHCIHEPLREAFEAAGELGNKKRIASVSKSIQIPNSGGNTLEISLSANVGIKVKTGKDNDVIAQAEQQPTRPKITSNISSTVEPPNPLVDIIKHILVITPNETVLVGKNIPNDVLPITRLTVVKVIIRGMDGGILEGTPGHGKNVKDLIAMVKFDKKPIEVVLDVTMKRKKADVQGSLTISVQGAVFVYSLTSTEGEDTPVPSCVSVHLISARQRNVVFSSAEKSFQELKSKVEKIAVLHVKAIVESVATAQINMAMKQAFIYARSFKFAKIK